MGDHKSGITSEIAAREAFVKAACDVDPKANGLKLIFGSVFDSLLERDDVRIELLRADENEPYFARITVDGDGRETHDVAHAEFRKIVREMEGNKAPAKGTYGYGANYDDSDFMAPFNECRHKLEKLDMLNAEFVQGASYPTAIAPK
ncbi:MAG: hypothetical protein H6861_00035 [Rhodospirillales bacterium]|nr:hypothetical protein [Rhodospirillales bacterium]